MSANLPIVCPKCGAEIPLDETLAAPMLAKVRSELDQSVKKAEREAQDAKNALAQKEREIAAREANISSEVTKAVTARHTELAVSIRAEVKGELAAEDATKEARINDLVESVQTLTKSLGEAERAKQKAELKAQSVDLEVAKQVQDQLDTLRTQVSAEADERHRLNEAQQSKTISDLKNQLDAALRKAEQGSQQAQGEVLELDIAEKLAGIFRNDLVEEVKKGTRGGDLLHRVNGTPGQLSGTILWETKRTATWGGDWIGKVKQDARESKAEIAVIVSEVLPKGLEMFGEIDGVWITTPKHAICLAGALRQGLIDTAKARKSGEGLQSKSERLYQYMMGSDFRARIEGIAQPFMEMQVDLIKEKNQTQKRWKQRERLIERVMANVSSLQGDLEGISGGDFQELPDFLPELPQTEAEDESL